MLPPSNAINSPDKPVIPSPVVGFSMSTPNHAPEPSPSYINFSPLFSAVAPSTAAVPPHIPRHLNPPKQASIRRSPRLDALSRPTGQSLTSIFSPSAFFQASRVASGEYGQGSVDDAQLESSFTIASHQDVSVLGRYQRYVQEHSNPADIDLQMANLQALSKKRRRYDQAVHLAPPSPTRLWANTDNQSSLDHYNVDGSGGDPALSATGHDNAAPVQADGSLFTQRMTPKTKVPVGAGGSSCHQCKNRREANQLNFCMNRIRSTTSPKKKVCRKKFCDHCLVKFRYQLILREDKSLNDWECPSCLGICVCAACKRKADPSASTRYVDMRGRGPPSSPVLTFAQKILIDSGFVGSQQRQHQSSSHHNQ